jgi:hypothetical protein
LLSPPPETLAALLALAQTGEILEIQQQALHLEETYLSFARKLRELAKAFEIDQIKVFVKQLIEEKQDENG